MEKIEPHKDHRERMRERFRRNGIFGFEDHEILEMLLFSVIPRRNTNDIAHALLERFGDIPGVLTADVDELCEVSGIGAVSAERIRFFGELYDGVGAKIFKDIPLALDDCAGMYAMLRMGLAPSESATALYLDKDGISITEEQLYRGKEKMTDDLPTYLLHRARENGAVSILLIHNHKNEPLEASPEDILITDMLRTEAAATDISVRHVIVSETGYKFI